MGAYVESSAGIAVGGRSGLTAVGYRDLLLGGDVILTVADGGHRPSDGAGLDYCRGLNGPITEVRRLGSLRSGRAIIFDCFGDATDLQHF